MKQLESAPGFDFDNAPTEVCVCRYGARPSESWTPIPPAFPNDADSSAWSMAECKWVQGLIVVVWVRRSVRPLKSLNPADQTPIEYITNMPPPGVQHALTQEERDLEELGRLAGHNVAPHASVPPVAQTTSVSPPAPPPSSPPAAVFGPAATAQTFVPYHTGGLPHYARERAPLAAQQNVTVRGGVRDVQAPTGPVQTVAPPLMASVPGVPGLYDVAVKACSAPLPPLPVQTQVPVQPAQPHAQATVAVSPPPARPIGFPVIAEPVAAPEIPANNAHYAKPPAAPAPAPEAAAAAPSAP